NADNRDTERKRQKVSGRRGTVMRGPHMLLVPCPQRVDKAAKEEDARTDGEVARRHARSGQSAQHEHATRQERQAASMPSQVGSLRGESRLTRLPPLVAHFDAPAVMASTRPTTATSETTIAVMRGSGDAGNGNPRRMARSLSRQLRKLISAIAT